MNINIYYGGRGIIDDPTLYVLGKMQEVLQELRVNVKRYNLYELKNEILTLPQTLKEADGIILATTVEWFGIGGYMQQFLDACWLFGDKEKIAKIYMCPVVMSTTYGEREAKLNLSNAWEILGGLPSSGMCGYIENPAVLELNEQYKAIIEKKAENLYRTINQHMPSFPASNHAVGQRVAIHQSTDLTPQETEQLSKYVSDDSFVQRQKEDIQELASLFLDKLKNEGADDNQEYLSQMQRAFRPQPGFSAVYCFHIEEKPEDLIVSVKGPKLDMRYGRVDKMDVEMHLNRKTMEEITSGRETFQHAFMTGARAKGDFKVLRTLDEIFVFAKTN